MHFIGYMFFVFFLINELLNMFVWLYVLINHVFLIKTG